MNKLVFTSDDGEEIIFSVEAQVRLAGTDYLLVTDGEGEDDAAVILKDLSNGDDEEARYVPVEDEEELRVLLPLFEEELDADIEE